MAIHTVLTSARVIRSSQAVACSRMSLCTAACWRTVVRLILYTHRVLCVDENRGLQSEWKRKQAVESDAAHGVVVGVVLRFVCLLAFSCCCSCFAPTPPPPHPTLSPGRCVAAHLSMYSCIHQVNPAVFR